jgi:RimJ/RimL family protein N-acetyltransferase
MDESLTMRRLLPTDADALVDFYQSLRPETLYVFGPFRRGGDDEIRDFLADTEAARHASWGLVADDGTIEGHVFFRHLDRDPPELGIGLRERRHGQGWGRRLMVTALAWADARPLPVVMLTVFKINHRARRLYESCGFVALRDHTGHEPDDALYMERARP